MNACLKCGKEIPEKNLYCAECNPDKKPVTEMNPERKKAEQKEKNKKSDRYFEFGSVAGAIFMGLIGSRLFVNLNKVSLNFSERHENLTLTEQIFTNPVIILLVFLALSFFLGKIIYFVSRKYVRKIAAFPIFKTILGFVFAFILSGIIIFPLINLKNYGFGKGPISGVKIYYKGSAEMQRDSGKQYFNPKGLAVSGNGSIYAADSGGNKVYVFDKKGAFLRAWGGTGTEQGMFISPTAVAIDNRNCIYVADSGNSRIQKFDHKGRFMNEFYNGFNNPKGLAFIGGKLLVADTDNSRIVVLDRNGKALREPVYSGSVMQTRFYKPTGIAADKKGNIYVIDKQNNIVKFDKNFNRLQISYRNYGFSEISNSGAPKNSDYSGELINFIALDNKNRIYCMHSKYPVIDMYKFYRGEFIRDATIGYTPAMDSFERSLNRDDRNQYVIGHPSGIFFKKGGLLYISDDTENKIHIFEINDRNIINEIYSELCSYADMFILKFRY